MKRRSEAVSSLAHLRRRRYRHRRRRRRRPVRLPFAEGCTHASVSAKTRLGFTCVPCTCKSARRVSVCACIRVRVHIHTHIHGHAELFARHVCRRVASRPELTVARYRSFEATVRCRCRPHDNIDKRLSCSFALAMASHRRRRPMPRSFRSVLFCLSKVRSVRP